MSRCFVIGLALLFFVPITVVESSSLFFESTYDSELNNQGFGTIEINENGTLGYASFGKTLIQFSTIGKNTIQSKIFDHDILATALSPDDKGMAGKNWDGGTGSDKIYVFGLGTIHTQNSFKGTGSNASLLTMKD